MMRLVLSAALLLAPSVAAADDWDAKQTREVQARYGECVVKKHHATARRFVLTPDMEPAVWRRSTAVLGDGRCLVDASKALSGVEMKFPGDTFRYALAEALVRREFPAPVTTLTDAAPLDQPTLDEADYQPKPGKRLKEGALDKLKESRNKQLGVIFLSEFGECVVREGPLQSHSLLMTEASTLQEDAAFKALMPQFGKCFPAGVQQALSRTALRGAVAMNYYRLAHAPRAVPTPAGASQ